MFKTVALVLLVVLAAVSAQQCPVSGLAAPITGAGLVACPSFNGVPACCNSTTEVTFAASFTTSNTLSKGNCPVNLKNLLCNIICSPNQAQFIMPAVPKPMVLVAQNTSNFIYDSCSTICLNNNKITNFTSQGTNRGGAFFGLVNLALGGTSAITFNSSTSATAVSLSNVLPAIPADASGCPSATTSTTGAITGGSTTNVTSTTTSGSSSTGTGTTITSTTTTTTPTLSSSTTTTSSASSISVVFALFSVLIVAVLML